MREHPVFSPPMRRSFGRSKPQLGKKPWPSITYEGASSLTLQLANRRRVPSAANGSIRKALVNAGSAACLHRPAFSSLALHRRTNLALNTPRRHVKKEQPCGNLSTLHQAHKSGAENEA